MEYDIKNHLAQQIENFLNAFAGADVQAMERIKRNILDIYKNSDSLEVVTNINGWDKKKQENITKLYQKAQESIKTLLETKNSEELFIDLDEIRNDLVNSFNELESDYWEGMRSLFLKTLEKP